MKKPGVSEESSLHPSPFPGDPPSAAPVRVLLIEDNPQDARLIQVMLAEAGGGMFELERVDRLSAGLGRLQEGGIGLVLLDLSLPDSHGLATFSKVHSAVPRLPIIVLSRLDDQTVAVNAVHEGAQDFLVKGQVGEQLLVRAMRYALERKRTADQLARYSEELRAKNAQMEADCNLAREIQQVFLPQQYPVFPRSALPSQSALRFYHRYQPAAAVGGDFFNIFAIDDSTAGIFICDVMGHGMRAALVTAVLRGVVEQLLPMAADAGQFLAQMNHSLYAILERTAEPMLATAFYLIADARGGELRYASAGHPSPFHIRRSARTVEPLKFYDARHGPALGLFGNSDYPVCHLPAAAGDLILLFTDGLYEVYNRDDKEYGQDQLLAAVRQRIQLSADSLFDELRREVREYGSDAEFDDDVCLVGVEIARVGEGGPAEAGP